MGNNKSKNKKIKEIKALNIPSSKKSNSICKIKIETQLESKFCVGFLLKFIIDQDIFYCLISNVDDINNDVINNKDNNIYISYDSEIKETKINLDKNKRYIKNFTDINLNIIVIEILDEDNIPKDYFLYSEDDNRISDQLINNKIYIPYLNDEKEIIISKGIIEQTSEYEFIHSAKIKDDLPSHPIISESRKTIIGISKKNNMDNKNNKADFIYPAINIIKEYIRKKRSIGKYLNGKYIWEDGKYYKGKFKNNLPNGKGIKYYSNGNIMYEGDFINGKFEGNGKFYYDDGDYFIGKYKNDLRNGKGILYYKNGNIMFEGEYIKGVREGKGKYYYEDGQYYIGQYKKNLPNGKGKLYYSNGKIKYEGDFINDKFEGNGKYYWEDGEYYIGQEKNDLRNGKGILYYSNGKIKYEGDYVNDIPNGYGRYNYENGEYYIGQWKNYLKHGKGILYDSNGKIINKGKWYNDEFSGI